MQVTQNGAGPAPWRHLRYRHAAPRHTVLYLEPVVAHAFAQLAGGSVFAALLRNAGVRRVSSFLTNTSTETAAHPTPRWSRQRFCTGARGAVEAFELATELGQY